MKTFRALVGNLESYTNIYVVVDENSKEGILIDPAGAIKEIANYVESMEIKLKYIILTHCHADHVAGIRAARKEYPRVPLIINEDDKAGLADSSLNMSDYIGIENNFPDADILVKDGDAIKFGDTTAYVIHTPGHTAGSMCLLIEDALFSGDTLFKGTHGRTDLKSGSEREIMWSIKDKLLKLPDDTVVYPGHGLTTRIGDEKNLYMTEEV